MIMYRLQHKEPYNYRTGPTKNICFAERWKDIALSEDFFSLAEYAVGMKIRGLQIVDNSLAVIWRN